MFITSPDFESDEPIAKVFTCDGENKNPSLEILDVPDEAQSLALILDDPDAPSGTFLHWMIWNIPPTTALIPEVFQAEPPVVEGKNGRGKPGYTGPCPPPETGLHHYHFKLYALKEKLNLSPDASKEDLEREIEAHQLANAELVGTYTRTPSP